MTNLSIGGSKSLYIRTLCLSLLNNRSLTIQNPSRCQDAQLMESLMLALGAKFQHKDTEVIVTPPAVSYTHLTLPTKRIV